MYKNSIILLLLIFVNYLNTKQIEKVANDYKSKLILHDEGFELLPRINHNVNTLINIIPIILIIYSILNLNKKFVEITSTIIIMMILRMIANRLTILPHSDEKCKGVTIQGGCYDKMFSGHTALTVLLCLFYNEQSKNIYIPCILVVIQIFLLISTRSHYTIDVYIGLLVALLIYTNKNKIII